MSASVAIVTKRSNPKSSDAGYKWFLENRNELLEITASDDLLHSLQNLERQHNLPEGTAERFKALYDHASTVSEFEEVRYAITWDAYHEALDSDQNLATIARAYGQAHLSSLHHRIDATGTFIF
jgi:hypothetical protein